MTETAESTNRSHIMTELGLAVVRAGDELHGTAPVTPEMYAPGTSNLRTSILAAWSDIVTGLLATVVMSPRVPVTLELDIHLYRPAPSVGPVRAVGRTMKHGRSVFVAEVSWTTETGEPIAIGAASFMLAPDTSIRLPANLSIDMPASPVRLAVPLAERARCEHLAPGVVSLPRSEDGLNASNTINGGLIALAAEEAALSLAPGGTLSSLSLRYLQAARIGPLVATASAHDGLGQVQLRDSGNGDRLCASATTRAFR